MTRAPGYLEAGLGSQAMAEAQSSFSCIRSKRALWGLSSPSAALLTPPSWTGEPQYEQSDRSSRVMGAPQVGQVLVVAGAVMVKKRNQNDGFRVGLAVHVERDMAVIGSCNPFTGGQRTINRHLFESLFVLVLRVYA